MLLVVSQALDNIRLKPSCGNACTLAARPSMLDCKQHVDEVHNVNVSSTRFHDQRTDDRLAQHLLLHNPSL